MPAGLEILCFAFMMASTVGLLFWAGQGRGTAAAFMGLVWDVGAPILCGIALFTGLEDLAALRASMSGAVFASICVLSLTRLFALVFTLRSGFFPVAGAGQVPSAV